MREVVLEPSKEHIETTNIKRFGGISEIYS